MLVLVDGVRLNDAQSGHHNGDIPVPLDAVERIEILHGPGSSLFGADAFGGTVNVITRRDAEPAVAASCRAAASAWPAAAASGVRARRGARRRSPRRPIARRASCTTATSRRHRPVADRTFGDRTHLAVSYLWKEFGANNFYGGNAPSREWTNQTLVAADHRFGDAARAGSSTAERVVSHARRSLPLQPDCSRALRQPAPHARRARPLAAARGGRRRGIADRRCRGRRRLDPLDQPRRSRRWRASAASASGGRRSGRACRSTRRCASIATTSSARRGVRPPALAGGRRRRCACALRRARAFRVPTFTERYYSDPANLARAEVGPETRLGGRGRRRPVPRGGWMVQATLFGRADRTSSTGCGRRPPIAGRPTTSATWTRWASSWACARPFAARRVRAGASTPALDVSMRRP